MIGRIVVSEESSSARSTAFRRERLGREFAEEHLDWAKTAKSDRERQTFEQMAEAWLEAAALRERVSRAEDGST